MVNKIDFDDKLKNLKKAFSNEATHTETERKLTYLTNKVVQISEKGYDFLLARIYLTGSNSY